MSSTWSVCFPPRAPPLRQEYHLESLQNLRQACANTGKVCAVLLDTKGPEIRTGMLEDGEVELKRDALVTLTTDYTVKGTSELIAVSYEHMARDVKPDDRWGSQSPRARGVTARCVWRVRVLCFVLAFLSLGFLGGLMMRHRSGTGEAVSEPAVVVAHFLTDV